MKKKLIAILMIVYLFLKIVSTSSTVFGADYVVTGEDSLYLPYEKYICNFIQLFEKGASDSVKKTVADLYNSGKYIPFVTVYIDKYSGLQYVGGAPNTFNAIYLFLMNSNGVTATVHQQNGTYLLNTSVNIYKYANTTNPTYYISCWNSGGVTAISNNTSTVCYCVGALWNYHSTVLDNYMWSISYGSNSDIINALNECAQHLENIENHLKDTTVNDSDFNMSGASDSTNDITASGFDALFSNMQSHFTSDSVPDIVINIPFTDKSFTFNGNMLKDYLNNNGGSWVVNIMSTFWYFVVSYFIFKDIYKIINKLKNGNISSTDTNIKADML